MKGKEIGVEKREREWFGKFQKAEEKIKKWERTPTKKIGLAQKF